MKYIELEPFKNPVMKINKNNNLLKISRSITTGEWKKPDKTYNYNFEEIEPIFIRISENRIELKGKIRLLNHSHKTEIIYVEEMKKFNIMIQQHIEVLKSSLLIDNNGNVSISLAGTANLEIDFNNIIINIIQRR